MIKKIFFNGFTLLELIVTLVIIMVIAGFSFPKLLGYIERTKAAEGIQTLSSLLEAQKVHEIEFGNFSSNLNSLGVEIRPSENFQPPTVSATDPLASVRRTGSYTLSIDQNGDITCSGGSGNICSKIGY